VAGCDAVISSDRQPAAHIDSRLGVEAVVLVEAEGRAINDRKAGVRIVAADVILLSKH